MGTLYENIKARRLALGLTQSELADKMGYSDKSMISKIEKGKVDLTTTKIMEFAKVLKADAGDLMGWDEQPADDEKQAYYLDPEAAELAQKLFDRPELRVLFDATKDVSKDDIQFIIGMLDRMRK